VVEQSEAIRRRLRAVPDAPGVYLLRDTAEQVIYVGKALRLRDRLRSYFTPGYAQTPRVSDLVKRVHDFEFVRAANRELDRAAGGAATALATFERIMGVLDVLPTPRALTPEFRRWIEEQLAARERARKTKDFEEADRIRVELRARDVELEDTPSGTKWRVL